MDPMTMLHDVPDTKVGFKGCNPVVISPHNPLNKSSNILNFVIRPNLQADLIPRATRLIGSYRIVDHDGSLVNNESNVSCVNFLAPMSIQKVQVKINGRNCPEDASSVDVDALLLRLLTQYTKEDRKCLLPALGYRKDEEGRVKFTAIRDLPDLYCK